MAPINGKPFLDYLIYTLIYKGIKEIIFLTGYKANIIEERYNDYGDVVLIIDKYCRACGKRINLAEDELYNGHCNICTYVM